MFFKVIVVVCPLDVIVSQLVERFDGAVRTDDAAVEEEYVLYKKDNKFGCDKNIF